MSDPTTEALRRRQLALLLRRFPPEDVILTRVLADHHQHAATTARSGRLDVADAELRTLGRDIPLPEAPELRRVVDLAALPATALVRFGEGRFAEARGLLLRALDVGAELASAYGHDYLTGKRLHLGANLVRVATAEGRHEEAAALLAHLRAVSAGDRERWPFAEAATLDVPLPGDMHAFIHAQLRREADRLAGAIS